MGHRLRELDCVSVPWKPNWHYFRVDVNADDYGYLELQCNDGVYDLRDLDHEPSDPYHDDDRTTPWSDIDGFLNPIMSVQTNAETQSFLYVDALVLSVEDQ